MIRIVKMTFKEEEVDSFLNLFEEIKPEILKFPGIKSLKLLKDQSSPNVYFTLSEWNQPQDLENYRHSEFFKNTWERTKRLFKEKAQAWSLDEV